MKKTYMTPTLVESGEVVDQTLNGVTTDDEEMVPAGKIGLAGSIGYYL
jgi:hypothetical protein